MYAQKSEEVNSVEKRRPSVASDSDEPASPAKRSKAMSSVDSDSDTVNSNKYKSVTTQSDDTEDEAPPVKRGRRSAFNNSIADTVAITLLFLSLISLSLLFAVCYFVDMLQLVDCENWY